MRVSVIFGSRVILPKNIIILYARLNCTRISHEKRIAARQLSERSNIPASQGNCGEIEKFIMYGGKSAVLSVGAEIGGMRSSVRRAKQKIRKDKKFAPPAVQNSEKTVLIAMPKLKAERSLVRSAEALPKNLQWFV